MPSTLSLLFYGAGCFLLGTYSQALKMGHSTELFRWFMTSCFTVMFFIQGVNLKTNYTKNDNYTKK
jgi:hypothetical protein